MLFQSGEHASESKLSLVLRTISNLYPSQNNSLSSLACRGHGHGLGLGPPVGEYFYPNSHNIFILQARKRNVFIGHQLSLLIVSLSRFAAPSRNKPQFIISYAIQLISEHSNMTIKPA